MTIRYECDECGSTLKIKDSLAGTRGKCPKCGKKFTVPAPEVGDTEPEIVPPTAPAPTADAYEDPTDVLFEDPDPGAAAPSAGTYEDPTDVLFEDPDPDDLPPSAPAPTASLFEDFETEDYEETRRKSRSTPKRAAAGSASGGAADLLARSAEDKRSKAGVEDEPDEEGFDYTGLALQLGKQGILPIVVICLLGWILYSLVNDSLGRSMELPELHAVRGVIMLDNRPFEGAAVTFYPVVTESQRYGASTGTTNANGEFELYYYLDHKGAVEGNHRVTVTDPAGSIFLPPEYTTHDSTILDAIVVEFEDNTFKFDLRSTR